MRTIEKTIYKFDELPNDKAKDKARQWYRDGAFDYDWWDFVYEDAERIAVILGIDFAHKHGRTELAIYFSGFGRKATVLLSRDVILTASKPIRRFAVMPRLIRSCIK